MHTRSPREYIDDTVIIHKKKGDIIVDQIDEGLLRGSVGIKKQGEYKGVHITKCVNGKRKRFYLGRLILNAPDGLEVDHINHNPLDNRRCNLRLATRSENARNNSGHRNKQNPYKGVVLHKPYAGIRGNCWRAYTRIMGKRVWLGYYATPEEAATAYNNYAGKTFGEFACKNIISQAV